jgi:arylsulfatase A-like enzyme
MTPPSLFGRTAAAAALFCLLLTPAPTTSSPPDIVFIVADDLGFNEMGFRNASRGLQTPNLDALASAGVILDSYYTPPLCSPTRTTIMTSRYQHTTGLQANVIYWDTPWAPDDSLVFLPQRLKGVAPVGYGRTAGFGKSHMGSYKVSAYPTSRGFDEWAGYLQGCGSQTTHTASCCDAPPGDPTNFSHYICPATTPDYRGFDWFANTTADVKANGTSSTELIAQHAEAFIAAHASPDDAAAAAAPYFLYLPFQNIHAPYDAAADSVARFAGLPIPAAQKVMFAYIYELDVAVGRVVAALEAAGTMNDTVLVFVSDNGAPAAPNVDDRNAPLRGYKAQVWEGGTRVPAFVHAPGRLPAGTRTGALVHAADWGPTLVEGVAGGTVEPGLDGVNVWATLAGGAPARHELPVNINPLCSAGQFGAPKAAFVMEGAGGGGSFQGRMKLVCYCYTVAGINGSDTTGCVPDPAAPPGTWPQLFNLTADPGETTNLAASLPAVVATLEARLAVVASSSVEPMVWDPPYQGADYACAACPKHPQQNDPYLPWEAWM